MLYAWSVWGYYSRSWFRVTIPIGKFCWSLESCGLQLNQCSNVGRLESPAEGLEGNIHHNMNIILLLISHYQKLTLDVAIYYTEEQLQLTARLFLKAIRPLLLKWHLQGKLLSISLPIWEFAHASGFNCWCAYFSRKRTLFYVLFIQIFIRINF